MKTQRAPRILFVSPDASQSGAPMVLLHLLRWLRANTNWRLELLLLRGGSLEADFSRAAHVVHRSKSFSLAQNLFAFRAALSQENIGGLASRFAFLKGAKPLLKIAEKIAMRAASREQFARLKPDLIYVNTIGAGGALRVLATGETPVVAHVHELEYAFARLKWSARETLEHSTHFVACSQAVKDNLTANCNADSSRIDVVYEFVETRREIDVAALRRQMRAQLKLPQDAFVVVGGGALEWRKGVDWWLQIARLTQAKCAASTRAAAEHRNEENTDAQNAESQREKTENGSEDFGNAEFATENRALHFVWIGAVADALFDLELRHDVKKMKLQNMVTFTGAMPDARDAFAAGDVFLLSSREDPFPLVCPEAAALGLPILCFQNAGGMPEFVANDAGLTAPYGDCETMSQHIFALKNDEELRLKLGARTKEKARESCDLSVGASQIRDVIERVLAAYK